jgi:hypothetical protein
MLERWFMMTPPKPLNAESFGGDILACVTMARGQNKFHCNRSALKIAKKLIKLLCECEILPLQPTSVRQGAKSGE